MEVHYSNGVVSGKRYEDQTSDKMSSTKTDFANQKGLRSRKGKIGPIIEIDSNLKWFKIGILSA